MLQELVDLYKVYGACPLFDDGLAKLSLINRAILRKHEEGRKGGNRKDLRLTNNTLRKMDGNAKTQRNIQANAGSARESSDIPGVLRGHQEATSCIRQPEV